MKAKNEKRRENLRFAVLLAISCALALMSVAALIYAFSIKKTENVNTAECSDGLPPVLRLHILANSDSEEDQRIKLKVRDAILEVTSVSLADCRDRDEAAQIIASSPRLLLDTADSVLDGCGVMYSSSLEIGPEYYPDREYAGQVYPAGEYLSVRVLLGEGGGHNWWCVLFPSLCLSAAQLDASADHGNAEPPEAVEAGLTPKQYGTITGSSTEPGGYVLRWRLWDAICKWFDSCKK